MTIVRHQSDQFIFSRQIIADTSISWKAKGLMAAIFSIEPNERLEAECLAELAEGSSAEEVKSIINELEKAGYVSIDDHDDFVVDGIKR